MCEKSWKSFTFTKTASDSAENSLIRDVVGKTIEKHRPEMDRILNAASEIAKEHSELKKKLENSSVTTRWF
jgi:hypothetical protein